LTVVVCLCLGATSETVETVEDI